MRRGAGRGGDNDMGTVISFPAAGSIARGSRSIAVQSGGATVVILPVVRIERYREEPIGNFKHEASTTPRRRRRRRANRS
jgi:hypothetical protein